MRQIVLLVMVVFSLGALGHAEEFLGAEICEGRTGTAVVLPPDSPLKLERAEVGNRGSLVLLLKGKKGQTLAQVDDLVTSQVGERGSGDEQGLQWRVGTLTAFAEFYKKGYVFLAVSSMDPCDGSESPAPTSATPAPDPADAPDPAEAAESVAPAAVPVAAGLLPENEQPSDTFGEAEIPQFSLQGKLKHRSESDGWVDVMGVIVVGGDQHFDLATFDLSFFDDAGNLMCVDTIEVTQLHPGQERVFRDWIQCAGFRSEDVASEEIQFAGGR